MTQGDQLNRIKYSRSLRNSESDTNTSQRATPKPTNRSARCENMYIRMARKIRKYEIIISYNLDKILYIVYTGVLINNNNNNNNNRLEDGLVSLHSVCCH